MGGKQPERDVGEPLMLTHREAARKIGISKSQLYVLLRQGTLHNLDLGPQTKRIATAECRAYVDSLLAEQLGEAS
jgi:predicted DNA-binding transcriptional regulator AlpA